VDIRTDVFTYLRSHLPGAVYLNTETLRASRGGVPTQLLDGPAYAALFSRIGLPFDQPVVIYSAGETHNIDATFLAWLLAGLGHRQVYVLDGGYFKWQLEQRPVVQQYPRLAETRFPAGSFRPEQASLEDVQRAVRTGSAVCAPPP
jgi:thiosulfate/3-mercaptopyruvate sulfurtransferase